MAISINGSTGISGVNGSAATPAIQGGDSDTGIFFGTDTASVATAGNERLIVDADGNINIDSGGVYYDAANNRLGIGTSSPVQDLHVLGTTGVKIQNSTDTDSQFLLTYTSNSPDFRMYDTSGNVTTKLLASGDSYFTGGNIGVGTASPGVKLQISGPENTNPELRIEDTVVGIQLYADQNDTAIFGAYTNHPLVFRTNGTEQMRLLSSGGLTFNGDTAQANALDDYEEGSWTPVIGKYFGNPIVTYTTRIGTYTKIGRMVYVFFDMVGSSISGGSGNAIISNLPYNVSSSMAGYSVVQFRDCSAVASGPAGTQLKGFAQTSSNYLYLEVDNSGTNGFANNAGALWNSSGRTTGYVIYEAA